MTHKTIRRAAITILFFALCCQHSLNPERLPQLLVRPRRLPGHVPHKSGGAKTASRNATAQSNASPTRNRRTNKIILRTRVR